MIKPYLCALVCATILAACHPGTGAWPDGGLGGGVSSSGSVTSSSSSASSSGGNGGTGGAGGGAPTVCQSEFDCPQDSDGDVCKTRACDPTGTMTAPGSKVLGCYQQDASAGTPCFVGCPGFCHPGPNGTPPLMCAYPPGSACLADAGDGG